jgi:hypothetical protein
MICSIRKSFNDKKYADCEVVFEKSGNVLYLHKHVLCANSEFFDACFSSDMIETKYNKIVVEDDEEELLTTLLEALYVGDLLIEDNTKIVPLLMIANKYLLSPFIEKLSRLISYRIDERSVIEYIGLPDPNNIIKPAVQRYLMINYELVLSRNDYLELDDGGFELLISTIVFTGNKDNVVQAVVKWIEHNVIERIQYCAGFEQLILKATGTPFYSQRKFDCKLCYSVTLSEDGKVARHLLNQWSSFHAEKSESYAIRMMKNCGRMYIGFTSRYLNSWKKNTSGYYLKISDGRIRGQDGTHSKYCDEELSLPGTVIEVILKDHTIRFLVNGKDYGVAFTNVAENVIPTFELFYQDSTIELIY